MDGIGIWFAAKILNIDISNRFNWTDVAYNFLSDCERKKWKIVFIGSDTSTILQGRKKLLTTFSNLQLLLWVNGFNEIEDKYLIERINEINPDIIWVGMGTPKQERWISKHSHELDCFVIQSVGDVFSLFAGTKTRGPLLLRKMGLEWLIRLITHPRRFWKRYLVGIPKFIFLLFCDKYLFSKEKNEN